MAPSRSLHTITAVRLPHRPASSLWDVSISDGKIASIAAHDLAGPSQANTEEILEGCGRLLAPSLCHAHIHLDKSFLLQDPKYADLQIESGDFKEALELTEKAKARFEEDDLLRRGRQLIEESIHHGVTAMRAFVEVDGGVQLKCLDAGLKLKQEFEDRCEVQICAFAQLPLFSGQDEGNTVRKLMTEAAHRDGVDVLGSTPYVEDDEKRSKANVDWITALCLQSGRHLDLHLDYFLDESKQPLVFTALDIFKERKWAQSTEKRITLGHCTRLTRFKDTEWLRLRQEIVGSALPVSFVGLPSSDLLMRTDDTVGTLPIVKMIDNYGLDAAIAVNNIGNAFTPHGSCDPLNLASWGVGLYQAGTKEGAELLYEAVSIRAKAAIGCKLPTLALAVGDTADLVLFDGPESGWRCRKSIVEVVYDAGCKRLTVSRGKVVAS